jgi:hypothetical protein
VAELLRPCIQGNAIAGDIRGYNHRIQDPGGQPLLFSKEKIDFVLHLCEFTCLFSAHTACLLFVLIVASVKEPGKVQGLLDIHVVTCFEESLKKWG